MKLSQREERYLKKLLGEIVFATNGWVNLKQENKLASGIIDKIELDKVFRDWGKED